MIRRYYIFIISSVLALVAPIYVFAGAITAIVPQTTCPLGYQAILSVVSNITNDAVYLAGIFAVLLIAYAGFLYATNAASPGNLEKGRNVLMSTVIGFVIVISAWLIVNEIIVTFTTGSLQSVTALLDSHSSSQCLSVYKPQANTTVRVIQTSPNSQNTTTKSTVKVINTSNKTTVKPFDPVKEANAFLLRELGLKRSTQLTVNKLNKSVAVANLRSFCLAYSQKVPLFSSGGSVNGTCTQADATQALSYLSQRIEPFLRTQITIAPGETSTQILAAEQAVTLKSIGLQVVANAIKSGSISGVKKTTVKPFDPVKEANAFLLKELHIIPAKGLGPNIEHVMNQSLRSLATTDLKWFCVTYSQKVPFFSSGVGTQGTCTQADATQALSYLSQRIEPFLRTQITIAPGETSTQILAAEQAVTLKSIGLQVVANAIKSGSISGVVVNTPQKTATKALDITKEAKAFLVDESKIPFNKGVSNSFPQSLAIRSLKAFCLVHIERHLFFHYNGAGASCTQTEMKKTLDYLSPRIEPFIRTQITIVPGATNAQILVAEQAYISTNGLQVVASAIKSGSIPGGL